MSVQPPTLDPTRVLQFWRDAGPTRWFKKDADFDAEFKSRFEAAHHQAASRTLDDWRQSAEGALALLILLDQYPRNAFRGSAHMFATDPLARWHARTMIERGFDRSIEPGLRPFCYMPFEHSEHMADQDLALQLFAGLDPESLKFARLHADIIRRFGRFPHRNAALGRDSTADELSFLAEGGFAG